MEIRVTGISEIGTERSYTYLILEKITDAEAFIKAIKYADDEYISKYENEKPIPNTTYKEFVKITKVEKIA